MATTQSNPPARADEKEDFRTQYGRASEGLAQLFGGSKGPGIFQQDPLPAGFTDRAQFVRAVMDGPGNGEFFKSLPQPFANVLATVMAARGNPIFPPETVVEFTFRSADSADEDEGATKETRVENLSALAEIHRVTDGRVSLELPFNGRLDFQRTVIGMFFKLSESEKAALQLGGERKHSSDLVEALEEIQPRTSVQRLSARAMRWAERREAARAEREQRETKTRQHGRSGDAAAALPQAAAPKPELEPAPAPAEPVIPDLSVLTGGGSAPAAASRAPRNKKAAAAVPAVPAIAPPAEEAKLIIAPTAADEDAELVVAAIEASDDPAAKAMVLLLRKGRKTMAEAVAFATRKGLL